MRRRLAVVISGALVAVPLAIGGQAMGTVPRLGILLSGPPAEFGELDAFMKQLSLLGWSAGRNLTVERRWTDQPDKLAALAAELLRLDVRVLLTPGPLATQAATRATATTPIVMIASTDPRTMGASSLAHPGGNLTGLTIGEQQVVLAKRLELLKQGVPSLSSVAVVWDVEKPFRGRPQELELDAAARALGLQLAYFEIHGVGDFEGSFKAARKQRAQAVLLVESPRAGGNRTLIANLGRRYGLPVMSEFSRIVKVGGLMSYGPSLTDLFQRAAIYVDKILKGAKPADLPIEQPTKYDLVINMKTARALGLTIPQSLLLRADEVIQ